MTAPRRGPRAPSRPSNRLASVLFGIGCLVVLTVTFALGVAAGRRWPGGLPLPGFGGARAATAAAAPTEAARGERETARRPEARGFDKDKAKTTTEGPPVLTFYHELTAPLTPPGPLARGVAKPERLEAKPERLEAKTAEPIKPASRSADAMKPVAAEAVIEPPREKAGEPRYTVQVGAFKLRSQADALRARLATSGQEAYVTEVETAGVMQYRVRVGAFATREAARDAAARLGVERRLATYVTTR